MFFFMAVLQIKLGRISKWRIRFALKLVYFMYNKVVSISFFTIHSA